MIIIYLFTEDNKLPFQHLATKKTLDRVSPFFLTEKVKFMLQDI